MPGRPRRGKARFTTSKNIAGRNRKVTPALQQASQTAKPVPGPVQPKTVKSTTPREARVAPMRYPYIATELRIIGILAAIIVGTLFILALIFP